MAEKITEAAVLALFRDEKITASRGAELLEMSLWDFMDLLHANGLTLWDDTPEEMEEDKSALRRLGVIPAVKPLLDELRNKGVLIREGVCQETLREAGESYLPKVRSSSMIILETERLLFRDHEEADLDAYCEMMAEPEFRRLSGGQPLSREEAEKSFRHVLRPMGPMGLLATVFKPESRYIGRCGLYPHRGENNEVIPGEAQLAYYLARPYWGRGLATEAGRAFVPYGFRELGLSRIVAGVNATNLASIRVLQKLGFVWIRSGEGGGNSWHEYELRNPSLDLTRCNMSEAQPN